MSYMYMHFDCCESTGDCGDATESKQDQILQAIADLQADVTDVQVGVDNIEDAVLQPSIC